MLTLDGSHLEGGGQLTRMALSLSAITGAPIRITNIRAGRGSTRSTARGGAGGGLKESHLAALRWLAEECNATVSGDQVGSREVVFRPGKKGWRANDARGGSMATQEIRLKSPGSVWLVFQAIFAWMVFGYDHCFTSIPAPAAAAAHEEGDDYERERVPIYDIILTGGTNVPKSMTTEYVEQVFLPVCEKIGLPVTVEIETLTKGWTTGRQAQMGRVRVKVYPRTRSTEKTSASVVPNGDGSNNDTSNPESTQQEASLIPILPAFQITNRGSITSITITILTSSPQTQSTLISNITTVLTNHPTFQNLQSPNQTNPTITLHPSSSTNTSDPRRLYILLVAHTSNGWVLGRDYLYGGKSWKSANEESIILKKVSEIVVNDLMREIDKGGCVDEFMNDQVVVFQALASGMSCVDSGGGGDGSSMSRNRNRMGRVSDRSPGGDGVLDPNGPREEGDRTGSLHARTVRWVCQEMLGKYGVEFSDGGICDGIGWNGRDGMSPGKRRKKDEVGDDGDDKNEDEDQDSGFGLSRLNVDDDGDVRQYCR